MLVWGVNRVLCGVWIRGLCGVWMGVLGSGVDEMFWGWVWIGYIICCRV